VFTPSRSAGRGNRLRTVTRIATSTFVVVATCAAAAAMVPSEALATTPSPAEKPMMIDGVDYPDPLRLNNGDPVTTAAEWENTRRAELLADFQQDVYGQDLPLPTAQTFQVTSTDFPGVTRKIVKVTVAGSQGTGSFDVKLFVPKTDGKPKGTFLMIDHRDAVGDDPSQSSGYAPVSAIVKAGYAFASFSVGDIAPDDRNTYRSKMIDLFYPADQALPDNAGRAISAWAWGASRAMDYLQTDPDIDPTRVAVIGHSRGGKAALWAGAQDTRFAAVIANDSGSTGAKLARRGAGGVGAETVAGVNASFPYWFPPTYKAYDDRVSSLPVDQHELLALIAPRRVVVASATDDANADPEGEFLAYVAAVPVYELYGLGNTGLPSATWPPDADQAFRGQAMSYDRRSGDHGLTAPDWDVYLSGDLFSR
jgi:Prolyl oligopeptidase family